MKENVLDVLIYLFENYMFDEEELEPDQETLALELSQAGFEHSMIDRAFDWLENLAQLCDENTMEPIVRNQGAIRHYAPEEAEYLGVEARGLLLGLEQCGVLDPISREMVINQLLALGVDGIDLDHLKWVILMVLSNYSNGEGISELTESLVLDGLHTCIH
jgi:Smg protein